MSSIKGESSPRRSRTMVVVKSRSISHRSAEAVVFAGDGQLIAPWGGALEAADAPPTMIVGAHRLDDETLRLHEYSPAFDRCGSQHTSSSLSRTCADGWGRVSQWRCPPSAPRCSVSRRVASSRSPLAFAIRTSTVQSSAPRQAGIPPASGSAAIGAARVSGRRHPGAVLPQERDALGESAARCTCGRRHDPEGRIARRRILARRVSAYGGVGVWTMTQRHV